MSITQLFITKSVIMNVTDEHFCTTNTKKKTKKVTTYST